jgi:hypothetical protein
MKKASLKKNIAFSAALATTALTGYYRRAYSACSGGTSPNFICSGSYDEAIYHADASTTLTTTNGFGFNNIDGGGTANAITVITSSGDVGFTDTFGSAIATSDGKGIYFKINDAGTGDISINSNSVINSAGDVGIRVSNLGDGTTDVIFNGRIVSEDAGISLSGDVSSSHTTLTLGSSNYIKGGDSRAGILINNSGANANITADIDGTINGGLNNAGLRIQNGATSSNITVTTAAGSSINGYGFGTPPSGIGMILTNNGTGSTTATINGDVTSARSIGISAYNRSNSTGNLNITTGSTSNINGAIAGIAAYNTGSGASIIEVNGNITSSDGLGIYFISTNAASDTTVTINGDITASATAGKGIHLDSAKAATLKVQNGSNISGYYGIYTKTTGTTITLDGRNSAVSVVGSSGSAIKLSGSNDDSITIKGDVTLSGDIELGGGTDDLTFDNANLTLASGSDFSGFSTLTFTGDNIVNGNLNLGTDISLAGNSLNMNNGSLISTSLTAGNAATFSGSATITNNVAFNSGSTFSAEINGSSNDKISTTTGTVTIDSAATLNIAANGASASATILEGDSLSGSFGTITNSGSNIVTTFTPTANVSLGVITLNTDPLSSQTQASVNDSILISDTLTQQLSESALIKGRNFWIRNLYRDSNVGTEISQVSFKGRSYGIAFGGETNINDSFKLGFSLAEVRNDSDIGGNAASRSSQSSFASIYTTFTKEVRNNAKFFSSLSLGVGTHDHENKRYVTNEGVGSYASSNSDDVNLSATLQAGIKLNLEKDWYAIPKLSASYIQTKAGGFVEGGGGAAAITINDYSFETLKLRESVRFGNNSLIATVKNIQISPYFEIGLSQEKTIGGGKGFSGAFSNGNRFSSTLASYDKNFVTSIVGTSLNFTNSVSGFVSFENAESSNETRNNINAGVRVKF